MTYIKDTLIDFNPWWKAQFALEFKDRDIYGEMKRFLSMPQIIALTGLRRVGKTMIMLKMAEDYISRGFDPRNIIYFSFDEFRDVGIRDVIKAYEGLMERSAREGRYLLLLDEIQKLHDWENQLKALYDSMGKSMKIAISGSESLFIGRKSKETLAGRIFEFKVDPLTFPEFLSFKGAAMKPAGLHERELKRLLSEFTLTLGFPELVGADKAVVRKYVKESIIEKIVFRDIPGLFPVKDTGVLESLLNIFTEEPGQLVEVSKLANEMNVSRQTLSAYLSYLEDSFLIRKLYNFSGSRRKTERKLKKIYPAIVSPDLLFRGDELSQSKVFEWLIVSQLGVEFFWRDPYKNEVDAVIQTGQKPLPIEIKYGKADFGGLLAFMRKFGVRKGYIISQDREEKRMFRGKSVSVVPAFKFLLDRKRYLKG